MILCLLSVLSPLIKLSGTGGNDDDDDDDDGGGDFVVVVVVVVDDDDDDSDLKTNLFEDKNVNLLLLFLHNNDITLLDIFYIILKIIT